ncbi:MAG: (S)-ureidoglycine aminohydrolase, partial [Anaerolineae bacterium]|nr:(S)-ureidoglycine aminohydrolase [Anaerolineae bacterium]
MSTLFGSTRSRIQPRHALIAPDSHVRATLPGWVNTQGITLISPAMGAHFTQYYALMEAGGASAPPAHEVERFAYVLEGNLTCRLAGQELALRPGSYVYCPAGTTHTITAHATSRLVIFERFYAPLEGHAAPGPLSGHVSEISGAPFMGDTDAVLRQLLPDTSAFDMAINLFTFNPGAALPFAEVHVMEHGLLMIEGQGIYRLDESWYPVQAGDAIWMGPYCPQW